MPIRRLLIANRGEIAVRIQRAARALGITTVQAVSEADRGSLAAALADEVVEIGKPQAAHSYLSADRLLDAAERTGADAIHPGYGFLAENAVFAARVEQAGLVFVGPNAGTIRLMGDKASARAAAKAAGVPTVPGSDGRVTPGPAARNVAATIGFPIMVKAAAGGGGRGIRVAEDEAALDRLLPAASAEAQAAFGDGGLYLERFIPRARHIEVQVMGDGAAVVHLFERECSLQRRRQKIWEEAPAQCLDEPTRAALCQSAVRLAQSVGYRGAGTLEYLFDDRTGDFYFIEMNTRIQVEHPVTEMITGIDLVREMLLVAAGAGLSVRQEDVVCRGHAIEVRINAEDPAHGFRPCPGTITALRMPGGPGVRFDTGFAAGDTVPPFYDSLLGKLIVWDTDRRNALRRMAAALRELRIEGVATTASLAAQLVGVPEVTDGAVHTTWLESWLAAREAP